MLHSSKRELHHKLRVIQRLRVWQLIVIAVLLSFVTATALRFNNLGMIERRDAVYAADKTGDSEKIKQSLTELQRYVSSHMNTDLGNGVYLQESYNRARDAALARVTDTSNPNSTVYQQASVECQSRFQGGRDSFRNDYVQCVVERVSALQSAAAVEQLQLPKADFYRYDYVSPLISFDLAGLLSVFLGVLALAILWRILFAFVLKMMLRRHRKFI